MADPTKPGNLPNTNPGVPNPGPPDYVISECARLLAGDADKYKRLLQDTLSNLKEFEDSKQHALLSKLKGSELSGLYEVLLEYQKLTNKESKQDHKLGALDQKLRLARREAELQKDIDAIEAAGQGGEALAMWIATTVADTGATLGDALGAIQGEINRRARRRNLAGLGAAGVAALLALFFGIRFLNPPDSKPGGEQAIPPNVNLVQPVITPTITPTCPLDLVNPASADKIPETGPLNVQWSNVPGAASYALKVIPPPSFSVPWVFPIQGTTRTIYMENFPAAGDYELSVEALDANGGVVCDTALKFTRSALVAPSGKERDSGAGGGCSTNGMFVICP